MIPSKTPGVIVGVDEAGRGPLAGPVVAAAVVLCESGIVGLDDSKKLSASRRAALEQEIKRYCCWATGEASVAEIDRLNILQATLLAMTRAVEALEPERLGSTATGSTAVQIWVDGNRLPAWRYASRAIVGGDALYPCISAASIIAKEYRDRLMLAKALTYPGYGWETNKGYGTASHLAALRELGVTPLHRRSFAPVRSCLTREI